MKEVYMDNAAATFVDPRVKAAMEPFWEDAYGNPGSFHSAGMRALKAVDAARLTVAQTLNCIPQEVIFTGSGTESINLALQGAFRASKKKHIITTKVEHHAVLETCEYLEKHEGAKITYVKVNKYGQVEPAELEKAITPDTVLVSIIYANNEIGSINNIKELTAVAKKHKVLFHTDACQAGSLALDVKALGVDLMSINGGKIHGPKGTGMLYARRGVPLHPLIHGGGQENNKRSGTENVPLLVGFATALQIAQEENDNEKIAQLRDKLIKGILATIPKTLLNGHPTERLPNNVNVSFMDIEGEALLLYLDEKGVYATSGSACTSKTLDPSHVVLATGMPYEVAHGSIRFTLSKRTTEEDVEHVLAVLPALVQKLRDLSPVNIKMEEVLQQ